MSPENNYPIGEKELLAIKCALENWRHLLEGTSYPIIIYSNHRNLQYLQQSRTLTSRQIRWSYFLDKFNFILTYRPGSKNGKADALSRMHDLAPAEPEPQPLLPPHKIIATAISLKDEIKLALAEDEIPPALDQDSEGLYFKNKLLYIPKTKRRKILQIAHDSPLAGHPGVKRTLDLVRRNFWWPTMSKEVQEYVKGCAICARSKHACQAPQGYLINLPLSTMPWQTVSLDFIVDLPISNGKTTILVAVDTLTKMAHFTALPKLPTAKETAAAFHQDVIRLHGLPSILVSDRGSQFTSKFWSSLCQTLKVQHKKSSAYHPQTNGQTERVNACIEQYLRCYSTHLQENWAEMLPLAEFSYNNSLSSSTGVSPFYANYGYHPTYLPPNLGLSVNPASHEFLQTHGEILR